MEVFQLLRQEGKMSGKDCHGAGRLLRPLGLQDGPQSPTGPGSFPKLNTRLLQSGDLQTGQGTSEYQTLLVWIPKSGIQMVVQCSDDHSNIVP